MKEDLEENRLGYTEMRVQVLLEVPYGYQKLNLSQVDMMMVNLIEEIEMMTILLQAEGMEEEKSLMLNL
jgi:hypothetical protein